MPDFNLWFGWVWITIGLVSGTIIGMFFHDSNWLGGFDAWPRRMVRLGHIAFLGTGFLNIAFVATVASQRDAAPWPITAWLFLAGAVAMPAICFLSAWRESFRYLFFVPVVCLVGASASLILQRWL